MMRCFDFGMEKNIFLHVGDALTEAEEQGALEFVIFNANVPLLLSNRLAVKVQRAATEDKSRDSSCLAKQRRRQSELACERIGGGERKGGRELERRAMKERKEQEKQHKER